MGLTVADTDPSGVEVVVGDLEVADAVDLDRSAAPAEPCEVCIDMTQLDTRLDTR